MPVFNGGWKIQISEASGLIGEAYIFNLTIVLAY